MRTPMKSKTTLCLAKLFWPGQKSVVVVVVVTIYFSSFRTLQATYMYSDPSTHHGLLLYSGGLYSRVSITHQVHNHIKPFCLFFCEISAKKWQIWLKLAKFDSSGAYSSRQEFSSLLNFANFIHTSHFFAEIWKKIGTIFPKILAWCEYAPDELCVLHCTGRPNIRATRDGYFWFPTVPILH